jgi:putative FmdB family regulatory protein
MPIYEYRCRACGTTAEELRSLDRADVPTACSCGATDRVRLPSLIARGTATAGAGLPLVAGSDAPAGGGGCCGGGCCGG